MFFVLNNSDSPFPTISRQQRSILLYYISKISAQHIISEKKNNKKGLTENQKNWKETSFSFFFLLNIFHAGLLMEDMRHFPKFFFSLNVTQIWIRKFRVCLVGGWIFLTLRILIFVDLILFMFILSPPLYHCRHNVYRRWY